MIMYHPNLVAKRSAVQQIWYRRSFLIKWALTVTLNLKTGNQSSCIFWPMMLHHHSKFDYRRFSSRGDIIQMNIHWNILNFFCDLDLDHNRAIQSFHKTIHPMMMCHQTKFSCKRISSSDNISKSHIMIILFLTVTLTLKTANQYFWKTIWLIMMHLFTKFGSKRFSTSKDIIWTNTHRRFEILLWPWS